MSKIDKNVVQHLLQRHIMLQWLEFRVEQTRHMFLLSWDLYGGGNKDKLEFVIRRDFPHLKDSVEDYCWYFVDLSIKNEDSYLPEHFETNIIINNWNHSSRKSCSIQEIREEYIYYIRKFLLDVAEVEGI